MSREVHPAEVGRAERRKPAKRRPPRAVLFDARGRETEVQALDGLGKELAGTRKFFFGDFHAPDGKQLAALQREFGLHPLAIDDVRTRQQRPKIDIYGNTYFLVFYRIRGGEGKEHVRVDELDFFIGPNFLLVLHDTEVPLLDEVLDRYMRREGARDVSTLLYETLDAVVDEYFPLLDTVTERSESIEQGIFKRFDRQNLSALLDLKRDLALLRRIVAPERDSINVLLRRDPPILDPAQIFYFQDIYDHLIRITDAIDTFRELLTGSLDAFLSVENNRLSEVVRKLTIVSTIFLPLNFVTGFFGMNFEKTSGTSAPIFYWTLGLMALVPFVVLVLLRRTGIR